MSGLRAVGAVLVGLMGAGIARGAVPVTYTQVAREFVSNVGFLNPNVPVALSDDGRVVFAAKSLPADVDGLFAWQSGTLTPINRNVAHAHLQAAVDSNIDAQATIKRWQKRGSATRNFTGSACGHCGFAKLCRAQMIGGADGEYIVEEYGLRVMGARAK